MLLRQYNEHLMTTKKIPYKSISMPSFLCQMISESKTRLATLSPERQRILGKNEDTLYKNTQHSDLLEDSELGKVYANMDKLS